uniref:VWFD domain-containing protein n=1 Tax=Eptatretus burgeri TaxID=7764 RepID=A0A8C4R3X4_EPTBU
MCGLCGNYNNVPDDEFASFKTDLDYVAHHTVNDANKCEDMLADEETKCNITKGDFLVDLLNKTCPLKDVRKTLEPRLLEDACNLKDDLQVYKECLQNSSCALCDTIAEANRSCAHQGYFVNSLPPQYCSVSCPEGQQYSSSDASCQETCSNPKSSNICVEPPVSGCVCPEGTVYDDIQKRGCVKKSQCSCRHKGEVYNVNQTIELHCQSCVCTKGTWKCDQRSCPKNCKLEGGSHVTTFDDYEYSFTGNCLYWFVKSDAGFQKLDVIVDIRICGKRESCIYGVTLLTDNFEVVYTSDMENKVEVNGSSRILPFSTGILSNVAMIPTSTF